MKHDKRRTLYLMDPTAVIRLDHKSVNVRRKEMADVRVPLHRINRMVIEVRNQDFLAACMSVVANGGAVHLQNKAKGLCAVIRRSGHKGTSWATDLAGRITNSSDSWRYDEWLRNQRNHAWSLVFGHRYVGDFDACVRKLLRYSKFYCPNLDTKNSLDWLNAELHKWLEARIDIEGFQPIERIIWLRGGDLIGALLPCLFIPLLWDYVRWARIERVDSFVSTTEYFELKAGTSVHAQFLRHVEALDYIYGARSAGSVDYALSDTRYRIL